MRLSCSVKFHLNRVSILSTPSDRNRLLLLKVHTHNVYCVLIPNVFKNENFGTRSKADITLHCLTLFLWGGLVLMKGCESRGWDTLCEPKKTISNIFQEIVLLYHYDALLQKGFLKSATFSYIILRVFGRFVHFNPNMTCGARHDGNGKFSRPSVKKNKYRFTLEIARRTIETNGLKWISGGVEGVCLPICVSAYLFTLEMIKMLPTTWTYIVSMNPTVQRIPK